MLRTVLAALILIVSFSRASAVVIDTSGTYTYQTTEPTSSDVSNWTSGWGLPGITGWNYVGQINNGPSAVYLGNGWVITAGHVGPGTFNLDGVDYDYVAGSAVSISDSTGLADITMFQISTAPDLPALTISPFAPTIGGSFVMIGYGGSQGETWGANTISEKNLSVQVEGYSYTTIDFSSVYSGSNLAQLVGGDSGGGDFMYNPITRQWEFIGINEAIDNTGTFTSYFVQLSAYSNQINSIEATPEPEQWMLLLLGLLALGVIWKIKTQSR